MREGDVRAIEGSGLFDRDWYLSEYLDVKALGSDPVEHYLRIGAHLHRNPGPDFDTAYYLSANPDVATAGVNPLLHYVLWGRAEGRRPLPAPPSEPPLRMPETRPENGAPVRVLPDAFALRSFEASAEVAVVVNAAGQGDWLDALEAIATVGPEHDVFLLGADGLDLRRVPAACRSVNLVGYADAAGDAAAFMQFVRSCVLDRYRAVCWLSPAEGAEPAAAGADPAAVMLEDEDCGLIADAVAPLRSVLTPALTRSLKILLPRLGRPFPESDVPVPRGGAVWLRPLLLRHIAAMAIRPDQMTRAGAATPGTVFPGRETLLALLGILAAEGGFTARSVAETAGPPAAPAVDKGESRTVKAIAFYLPQFHPIEENDRWWGRGFTEWTNVVRGRPLFRHHYQPRVPADLGFYDLRLPDAQEAQAALARRFGIHGFCYHYYWFNGRKLLNQPIEQMLRSGTPDFPFCICWANENWSRNWDGQNRHVLLEQSYSTESNRAFIREIIPMMKDPRYIRHHGRPVLVVYRISIIPDWPETARMWREECRRAGIGEIHLCAVRFGLEPLEGAPQDHGVDAYVLFPPHEAARRDLRGQVLDLHKDFGGEIFSYDAVVEEDLARFEDGYPWPLHRGSMLGWDNTARRLTDARVFHGASPLRFRSWMASILDQEARHNPDDESLVFINAWNEWAEGTTLEPDQRWGTGYLEAFRSAAHAVLPTPAREDVAAPAELQPKAPDAPALLARCGDPLAKDAAALRPPAWHAGEMAHEPAFPTVLLCAHISGHHLFGGERSFLDVLDALATMPVNVLVTLPSGNNRQYVAEVCRRSTGAYVFPYPQWMENRPPYEWLQLFFADIIARHDVALVHANTIVLLEPLIAARRLNRRALVHARELVSLDESLRERMALAAQEIVVEVFGRTDYVIGNSRATCRLFAREGRTFYVPNAVDVAAFDMPNPIGEKVRFGIVSSNIPKKGVADFIEVARLCAGRTERAEFVVVGPETPETRAWAADVAAGRLPSSLSFVGYRESPQEAMAELDVLLNLSSFAESFGRTVAEAMAARRPVIAYEWGALPELVEPDRTGLLAPYRDVAAVADAVIALAEDPAEVARMGEAGRAAVVEGFSQASLRDHLAEAYSAIFGCDMRVRAAPSAPSGAATPAAPARMTTVVVPVHNAPGEVERCLDSVLRHTDRARARVLVIDDASSDPRVSELLGRYEGKEGVRILRNPRNLGYTGTVNRGIREGGDDDIVLLNSDTVVSPKWLEGLRAAAYSDVRVGTVTAMSDNAGAFSFPRQGEANPRPEGLDPDAYALLILQATGACAPVDVPTGSGFCMFIRRALVAAIGLFDEEAFPRGYGEENDFCMRARAAGWRNLVSPWSFVYHVRSASFGSEKETLVRAGVDTVTRRYPDYAALVAHAFGGPEMAALRAATARALSPACTDAK